VSSGDAGTIRFEVNPKTSAATIFVRTAKGTHAEVTIGPDRVAARNAGNLSLGVMLQSSLFELVSKGNKSEDQGISMDDFIKISAQFERGRLSVFSLALIRTKPKRTYDEINDAFMPEGDHVPLLLARILQRKMTRKEFTSRKPSKKLDAALLYLTRSG
jgi:hypothetical protein